MCVEAGEEGGRGCWESGGAARRRALRSSPLARGEAARARERRTRGERESRKLEAKAAICAPPVPRASLRGPPCPGPLPWPLRSLWSSICPSRRGVGTCGSGGGLEG